MTSLSPTCPNCHTPVRGVSTCPKCGTAVPTGTLRPDGRSIPPPADTLTAAAAVLRPPVAQGEIGRLAHYRIIGILGQGGMGIVYRAEDTKLRRPVALKVMLPQVAANPRAKLRFLREARAAAAVEHDHVVPIFQVDEDRDTPFLAMPLLRGRPLAAALRERRQPPVAEAVRIAKEIAEGLAAAHARGLIHRDIKPANVWLEGDRRRVRLLDFGLARGTGDDEDDPAGARGGPDGSQSLSANLTRAGALLGTPSYMSPEQAAGRPTDYRTDLFSLGVVLYEMAVGRPPFTRGTVDETLSAVINAVPMPPSVAVPGLAEPLNELIVQMLEKHPDDRPGSAREAADELRQIELSMSREMAVVPIDELPPSDPFADLGSHTPPPAAPAAPPPRGRAWLLGAAVGLVLLTGGAVAVKLMTATAPTGTLVIDADDPDAEVTVRQPRAVVRSRTREREIVLPPGEYLVEPADKRDGLRTVPSRVTVVAGGRETVKVLAERKPVAGPPAPDPRDAEPNRAAAKWAFKAGGKVTIREDGRDAPQDLVDPGQLPDGPFAVVGVELAGPKRVPGDLRPLAGLPRLETLTVRGGPFDGNAWLRPLRGNATVRTLDLFETPLDVPLVEDIATMTGVNSLHAARCGVGDPECGTIAGMSRVRTLRIGDNPMTETGITALAGMADLRTLHLNGCPGLTARAVAKVSELPGLTELSLAATGARQDVLAALTSRTVEVLDLGSTRITDAGLKPVGRLSRLRVLVLSVTAVSDAGLEHLTGLPDLTNLYAVSTNVTPDGAKKFAAALPKCRIEYDGGAVGPAKP